ncbi:MAG: sterol desaturase family protein [Leptospirales bacterium]
MLWVIPVLGFALCCAALAGDVRQGANVRAFLTSTQLLCLMVGFFVFAFLLERFAPFRPEWNRLSRAEANDWAMYFLAIVPAEALARMVVFAAAPWLLTFVSVQLNPTFWPRAWPLWIQVGLGLLLFDLAYYWYHRLSHYWSWLWDWHRVHHTPDYLVASKGLRHTLPEWAGDIVLHTTVFALAGMPPVVIFWLYAFTIPMGVLTHANIALPNPAGLGTILNLPQTHRIHHDRDLRGGLKNFSAFTMFWDHVFRTYESPERYSPQVLGMAADWPGENLRQMWFSFLPAKGQTETRSAEAPSSSSLNPNRRGSLSRST